jgi:hypothetical protein
MHTGLDLLFFVFILTYIYIYINVLLYLIHPFFRVPHTDWYSNKLLHAFMILKKEATFQKTKMLNYEILSLETFFLGKGYFFTEWHNVLGSGRSLHKAFVSICSEKQPINLSRDMKIKIYKTVILSVL